MSNISPVTCIRRKRASARRDAKAVKGGAAAGTWSLATAPSTPVADAGSASRAAAASAGTAGIHYGEDGDAGDGNGHIAFSAGEATVPEQQDASRAAGPAVESETLPAEQARCATGGAATSTAAAASNASAISTCAATPPASSGDHEHATARGSTEGGVPQTTQAVAPPPGAAAPAAAAAAVSGAGAATAAAASGASAAADGTCADGSAIGDIAVHNTEALPMTYRRPPRAADQLQAWARLPRVARWYALRDAMQALQPSDGGSGAAAVVSISSTDLRAYLGRMRCPTCRDALHAAAAPDLASGEIQLHDEVTLVRAAFGAGGATGTAGELWTLSLQATMGTRAVLRGVAAGRAPRTHRRLRHCAEKAFFGVVYAVTVLLVAWAAAYAPTLASIFFFFQNSMKPTVRARYVHTAAWLGTPPLAALAVSQHLGLGCAAAAAAIAAALAAGALSAAACGIPRADMPQAAEVLASALVVPPAAVALTAHLLDARRLLQAAAAAGCVGTAAFLLLWVPREWCDTAACAGLDREWMASAEEQTAISAAAPDACRPSGACCGGSTGASSGCSGGGCDSGSSCGGSASGGRNGAIGDSSGSGSEQLLLLLEAVERHNSHVRTAMAAAPEHTIGGSGASGCNLLVSRSSDTARTESWDRSQCLHDVLELLLHASAAVAAAAASGACDAARLAAWHDTAVHMWEAYRRFMRKALHNAFGPLLDQAHAPPQLALSANTRAAPDETALPAAAAAAAAARATAAPALRAADGGLASLLSSVVESPAALQSLAAAAAHEHCCCGAATPLDASWRRADNALRAVMRAHLQLLCGKLAHPESDGCGGGGGSGGGGSGSAAAEWVSAAKPAVTALVQVTSDWLLSLDDLKYEHDTAATDGCDPAAVRRMREMRGRLDEQWRDTDRAYAAAADDFMANLCDSETVAAARALLQWSGAAHEAARAPAALRADAARGSSSAHGAPRSAATAAAAAAAAGARNGPYATSAAAAMVAATTACGSGSDVSAQQAAASAAAAGSAGSVSLGQRGLAAVLLDEEQHRLTNALLFWSKAAFLLQRRMWDASELYHTLPASGSRPEATARNGAAAAQRVRQLVAAAALESFDASISTWIAANVSEGKGGGDGGGGAEEGSAQRSDVDDGSSSGVSSGSSSGTKSGSSSGGSACGATLKQRLCAASAAPGRVAKSVWRRCRGRAGQGPAKELHVTAEVSAQDAGRGSSAKAKADVVCSTTTVEAASGAAPLTAAPLVSDPPQQQH
ncbi:hypothetical protein JKP88DRAFT_274078 [Tribonema minus]|uniref:Uncharacterized protein n=1 Tax=Tribonema minus TaxID=303371 RepID=A0A835YME5_9STRA|nr:hypothetical protein JKP88DRAFT_274078 [Tribonema minus]